MPDVLTITESRVQHALWQKLRTSSLVVMPNYTPSKWWECDVWSVTRAGYAVEHEIKLSLADYRADARKANGRGAKHVRLAQGDTNGPTRFWFVFSDSLLEGPYLDEWLASDVPHWAGVKVVRPVRGGRYLRLEIVRTARRLHAERVDHARLLPQVHRACYYRYWAARSTALDLVDQAALARQSIDRQLAGARTG